MILWNRNALNLNHFVYISFAIIFQLSSMLITHEILFASKKEDFDEKCFSIDNFVSIVTALDSSQQFSSLCVQHILKYKRYLEGSNNIWKQFWNKIKKKNMHNFKLNLNDLKKPFLTKMLSLQNTHITVGDIAETINCRILSFNLTFETSSHFGLCRRRGFGINLFSGRVDIPNILINIRIKKRREN